MMILLYLIELHAIVTSRMRAPALPANLGILDFVNDPSADFGLASGDYQARMDALEENTMEVRIYMIKNAVDIHGALASPGETRGNGSIDLRRKMCTMGGNRQTQ